MHRGFTLVEILLVVVMVSFAAIALDGLLTAMLRDIPRSSRVVQENTTLLDILTQMRRDISRAKGLPESFNGCTADEQVLLIAWPDSVICYQLKNGQVFRRKLTAVQDADNNDARVWSVPNAEVKWRVWRKNGQGYAVEIETYVKQRLREKWQKKMANSHLYFLGGF